MGSSDAAAAPEAGDSAIQAALEQARLNPSDHRAYQQLSAAYAKQHQADLALAAALQAIALEPKAPKAYLQAAAVYREWNQSQTCQELLLRCIEHCPSSHDAHLMLASTYRDLHDLDEFEASIERCLALEPGSPAALIELAVLERNKGNRQRCKDLLSQARAADGQLIRALVGQTADLQSDQEAREILDAIDELISRSPDHKQHENLNYARFECLHRLGDVKQAAGALQQANQAKLRRLPSNKTAMLARIPAGPTTPSGVAPQASANSQHVFIVGMPRSGSTLLVSILSMRQGSVDLGEPGAMGQAIAQLGQQAGGADASSAGNPLALDVLYRAQLETRPLLEGASQAAITIDKSLYNFLHCNVILDLIPNAKVIHSRRNPLDNILSMLRARLVAPHNYCADAIDAAEVIIAQEEAMLGFKERYGARIFTNNYEELTHHPEHHTQQLTQWLGWPWDGRYLTHHSKKRLIFNASAVQARNPIHGRSVQGWRRYAELLEPARQRLISSGLFDSAALAA